MGNSIHKFCCNVPGCGSIFKIDCSAGKATWLEIIVLLLVPIIFYTLGFNNNFIKLLILLAIAYASVFILQLIRCKHRDVKSKLKHSVTPIIPLLIVSLFIFIMNIIPDQFLLETGPVGGILMAVSNLLNTFIGGLIVGLLSIVAYKVDIQIGICA